MTTKWWVVMVGGGMMLGAAVTLRADDNAPTGPAAVYVQDSPAAAETLSAAEDRLTKDEPEEAAKLVQQVLQEHSEKLLPTRPGEYAEARYAAAKVLLDHPRLLAAYRQMYGPTAEKALSDAGEDLPKLQSVLSRFELTDAGLKAGLRIAGLSLEAGEPDAAAIVLSHLTHHPDLATQMPRWQELRASAAVMMGDGATAKQARAAMANAGDTRGLEQINRLAADLHHPALKPALTALDTLAPATVPPVSSTPLWSVPIDSAEQYVLDSYQVDRQQIQTLAKDGRYLNLMPAVSGQTVFINDGESLHAVDLSSGRTLWQRRLMDDSDDQGMGRTYGRWLPQGMDLNVAAVAAGRVVAVMGYSAMVTISPYYRTTNFSQLACLDARTGKTDWAITPDSLGEDFSDAFWYGRPIVSDGRVFATLRRRQRTQFQDAYVVAIDLRSGKISWMRHLGSAAVTNKPLSGLDHMLLEGGWVYVDSRIGTVAKLSAVDGSVQWLALTPIDDQHSGDDEPRPWQTTAPVLTDAGLIVLDRASQVVRVFNPDNGQVTQTIAADRWSNPAYIQRVGGDVLAVGEKLERLDGRTLASRWSYKPNGPVRGRGAVTGDRMYLPAGDALEVVDLSRGRLVDKLAIDTPANVLVLPGEVVAAQRKGVANYTTWDVASAMLHEQMRRHPGDPAPLMRLAWLALGTGRQDQLLDPVDKAIRLATADRGDASHTAADGMFGQLLEMARDLRLKDPQTRRTLFDRMAAITSGPGEEVTYRLALAGFEEQQGRFPAAVQQYQQILGEPSYRRQLYVYDSGSRQAGLEAQGRLRDLIAKHGDTLYAPYDAYAQNRLSQLKLEADPDPLIELAESYPLSSVAPEAMMLAAQRLAERGDTRQASSLYRRASQSTRDPKMLAAIYGQEVSLLLNTSQNTRARRVLRQLEASFPDVKPLRDGHPIEAKQWLAELSALPQAQPGNRRLNPPLSGPTRVLEGTLLRPLTTDPDDAGPDVLPMLGDKSVQMLRGSDLKPMWKHAETGRPDLLAMDKSRMFLWDGPQAQIEVLDTATGQVRWADPAVKAKLSAIRAPEPARNAPAEQVQRLVGGGGVILLGRQVRQRTEAEPMCAVSDAALAVADGKGRVIVYSPDTGKVLWQGATPVRNASQLLLEGRFLILAGNDEDDAPILCVYEAQTGMLVHRLLNSKKQSVMWAGVDDTGQLIYVSSMQIEAFDLNRGQATWVCKPGVQLGGESGVWMGGDRLVVQTRDDDLLWIDLAEGRVITRQPIRGTIRGPYRVVNDAEGWVIVGADHCMATNNDGVPQWHDALNDSSEVLAWDLADRHVVLLTRPDDPNSAGHLYILDRSGGAVRYEDQIISNRPIEDVNVASGRLMLSGAGSTAVLESSK